MRPLLTISTLGLLAACGASSSRQEARHPDGRVHEEYEMRGGVRHGKARVTHSNGSLASEGSYVAGKRAGKFVYFSEDGQFEYQALFINDEEVWRSTDRLAEPDLKVVSTERRNKIDEALVPSTAMLPVPWFSSLDRTTSLDRAGVQLGFGSADPMAFGSARRLEVFANYTHGDLGGYGQFSQTSLELMNGLTLSGRQTLEGGGTYRVPLTRFGTTTGRLGVLIPLRHDDGEGFVAGTAGSFQRPTDAAASVSSSVAVRTSASFTRVMKRFVVQADAGVDWLIGGEPSAFDALARANLGVGFGSRRALLSLEVVNTVAISEVERRLHAIGIGAGASVAGAWLSGVASYCSSGDTTVTMAVGYEL